MVAFAILNLLGPAALVRAAVAEPPEKPYRIIVAANVFRLQPPPTRPLEQQPPPPPLPRIYLNGITTMLGAKRALLQVLPMTGRDQQSKGQSCILMEGQHSGDLQVLEINEKTGRVKLSYADTIVLLTLEKDAPPARGAPPVPPPVPPQPPQKTVY